MFSNILVYSLRTHNCTYQNYSSFEEKTSRLWLFLKNKNISDGWEWFCIPVTRNKMPRKPNFQFLEVWSTEDRLTWQTVINLLQTWRKNAITMSLCFWKHIQKSTFMQQRKKQGKTHLFCLPSQQPQTVTNTGTLVLRENIFIYLSGISLHMYDICIANIHISYKYTHTQKNYTYI